MSQFEKRGIRAFIALDIPDQAKEDLETIQFDFDEWVAEDSVRWLEPASFHLTLFFLGDGNGPDQIGPLCDTLDRIGSETRPFQLSLGKFGTFPDQKRPNIFWVGIDGDQRRLKTLKKEVDDGCQSLGWQPENRPYRPHVTLGRLTRKGSVNPKKLPYGSHLVDAEWRVTHIHLYHSILTKQGPVYKKIHSALFAAEA